MNLAKRIAELELEHMPPVTDVRFMSTRDLCRWLASAPPAELQEQTGCSDEEMSELVPFIREYLPGYGL